MWCAISSGKAGPVKKLKKAPIVNLSLGEVAAECKRLVIVCSIKPTDGASSLMSHCIPRGRITLHSWCSAQKWIFSSLTPKWRWGTLIKWWSNHIIWWWINDEPDDISRGRMLVTIMVIELGQRALLVGGGRPFDSANGATRLLSWWWSVIMIIIVIEMIIIIAIANGATRLLSSWWSGLCLWCDHGHLSIIVT